MVLNEREEKMAEVRDLFLKSGHGRYKLLKQILTPAEFSSEEPFVLIKQICNRLSIQREDFNQDSFRRWLKRNRMKQEKLGNKRTATKVQEEPSGRFQFTNPTTLPKTEEPLIKFS